MSENLEVVEPTVIESLERAQVDVQIATAMRFPRVLSKVKERMLSYATLDEETAESCFYTLPARKGGDGKKLQGPSVRLAEIALASYQHVKAGSRIIGDDGKFITAQAVVHDLENNVSVSIEVKRRVTTKDGHRFSDDMIAVTGNAATSIALRNAVFRVVPRALINPVYEAALKVAVGDQKSLVDKRARTVEWLAKKGVTLDRVLSAVGASKLEDVNLEQLETLKGLGTSIKDGEITVEEAFPVPGSTNPEPSAAPTFKEKRAKKTDPAPTPEPVAAEPAPAQTDPTPNVEQAPADQEPAQPQDDPILLAHEQQLLAEFVAQTAKADFDTFRRGMLKQSNIAFDEAWDGFHDIPIASCMRAMGAKKWLLGIIESGR